MTGEMASRSTKIVATLGPASSTPEQVRELLRAGMNCARINASHGDHQTHRKTIETVRAAAAELGIPCGILYDLQGPKIRIGAFEHPPVEVAANQEFVLAVARAPETGELPADHPGLDKDVQPGDPLLIDDGKISCEVIEVKPGTVRCRAREAGVILPRKGINLPRSQVSVPAVTDKDKRDAEFALEIGVDVIALSFVRTAADVKELERFIADRDKSTPIVAKIEKPQAIHNLDAILRVAWGVMVARGDLGVELSPEEVPVAQKEIIAAARRRGRPVITATQMLDSMQRSSRPTRAEASDVANAVLDGTDAVMLSGETATGDYPVESVRMMGRIIESTQHLSITQATARRRERHIDSIPEAVADAGCQVAYHLGAHAIVAFTQTGSTALLTARRRPLTPTIAFSPNPEVCNRLCLAWGVRPYLFREADTTEQVVIDLNERLLQDGLAEVGDLLVLIMGAPMDGPGKTNVIMVRTVESKTPTAQPTTSVPGSSIGD